MNRPCPRLVIGALRGSAGKTTVCAAVAAALRRRGQAVVPFKKGPDYIDAAWLALAASNPCRNLDTFMMGREEVVRSFSRHAASTAVSLIEGNRGLYDGSNPEGEHSTAELSKLCKAPVVLIVDCDKVTRTLAAMVLGCQHLDPDVEIRGVILNRVSGHRHASVVEKSIVDSCGIPILGTVPRMADVPFSERHLGLIPPQEDPRARQMLEKAAQIAEDCLDMDALIGIAGNASPWADMLPERTILADGKVTIGVVRDSAFQFYYPENLEALAAGGARIVEINSVSGEKIPDVDALYIGGGFPETHAEVLAKNESFRRSLCSAAEAGLPVYAECGGFMFLGESLMIGGSDYPMAGFFPIRFVMEKKPQGHGYTVLNVEKENPFFPVGTELRGHEFHYSRILSGQGEEDRFAFHVKKGKGIDGKRDGLCRKNVLAGFTHLHALGTQEWAACLVGKAKRYQVEKRNIDS